MVNMCVHHVHKSCELGTSFGAQCAMTKKLQSTGLSAQEAARRIRKERSSNSARCSIQNLTCATAITCVAVLLNALFRWWFTVNDYLHRRPIPRLNASDPQFLHDFFELYHGRIPVVIENALDPWPARAWTPDLLRLRCPDARLPVYAYDLSSNDWAALRDAGELQLTEYLQKQFGQPEINPHATYGLEMSMREQCPSLLDDIRIPSVFADDVLVLYYKRGAWPTLIVGPRGTQSGLHRDTHDLPFWMALFHGRKRWHVFMADDEAVDQYFVAERNGFKFNSFSPDFVRYPGLRKATLFEHELVAGELLYIPSGAPHAAYNLEDAIAISGNYLDGRGLDRHNTVTCQRELWRESKLCWAYDFQFSKHRSPPIEKLVEKTFFQHMGFSNQTGWCHAYLKDLTERLLKRPELQRSIRIVEAYCGMNSG